MKPQIQEGHKATTLQMKPRQLKFLPHLKTVTYQAQFISAGIKSNHAKEKVIQNQRSDGHLAERKHADIVLRSFFRHIPSVL